MGVVMRTVMHRLLNILAWLPVYTAIVVTLTLLVILFGPH